MARALTALLILLVVGWLSVPVGAEPTRIGVFWVDTSGVRSGRMAEHWQPLLQAALQHDGTDVVLLDPLPGDNPVGVLPRLLCAGRWAEQGLSTSWVMTISVGPDDAPAIRARLLDLRDQAVTYHFRGGHIASTGWTRLAAFMREALQEAADLDAPVIGVDDGHLYHKVGAAHVAESGHPLGSAAAARQAGWHACPICYPAAAGMFDDDGEAELGADVSRSIEKRYTMSRDSALQERVNRVGMRLVRANNLQQYSYTFTLLDTHQLNAFSAGAGHVYITTALLQLLESDDELACVLGHEIGHCEAHHVLRSYRQTQTVSLVGVVLSMATGSSVSGVLSNFLGTFFTRGFSRSFEREADYRGLVYASRAGYQPGGFLTALHKLHEVSASTEWLSTHPTAEDRIQQCECEIAALQAYEQQTASVRVYDPGVADELEQGMVDYLSQPDRVQSFLQAYRPLVPATATPTTPPPPDIDRDE